MAMSEYKTMRVPEDDWKAAKESKHEKETWGEFLQRCTDNSPEVKEFVEASGDSAPVTLEATEYAKIADEVEGRMR